MRLQEFISEEEWQRLEQLIYASTYKAITAYQQQRATQQSIAAKPVAKLKPQVAKKARALARKAKQPPHAAPPRPLTTPQHVPQAKAEATPAYRPIKTVKPLPPTTRMAVAKAKPQASMSVPNKAVQQVMPQPPNMDQAGRNMLPANKRGQNPLDMLAPQ
jgi:hypothetical protein